MRRTVSGLQAVLTQRARGGLRPLYHTVTHPSGPTFLALLRGGGLWTGRCCLGLFRSWRLRFPLARLKLQSARLSLLLSLLPLGAQGAQTHFLHSALVQTVASAMVGVSLKQAGTPKQAGPPEAMVFPVGNKETNQKNMTQRTRPHEM